MLTLDEKKLLLQIARQAIEDHFRGEGLLFPDLAKLPPALRQKAASFVTLYTKDDQLRGCMGTLEPVLPLAHSVYHNAIMAAFRDPRFPPLQIHEWPDVKLEVSVLTPKEPFFYQGFDDLVARLPRGSGVILEHPLGRATFLPKVWEKLPDPYQFLVALAQKAGFGPDVYDDPRTRIYTYSALDFSEESLTSESASGT